MTITCIAVICHSCKLEFQMYRSGPSVDAETINCWQPLPPRVPGENYSYSDHEAVAAMIRIKKSNETCRFQSGPEFRRSLSVNNRNETVQAVHDAINIIDKSLSTVDRDQFKYVIYSFLVLLMLTLTFIPTDYIPQHYFVSYDLALFLPRFILTVFLVIFFLMASLFNKREKNALISTKKELKLIIDRDYMPVQE